LRVCVVSGEGRRESVMGRTIHDELVVNMIQDVMRWKAASSQLNGVTSLSVHDSFGTKGWTLSVHDDFGT